MKREDEVAHTEIPPPPHMPSTEPDRRAFGSAEIARDLIDAVTRAYATVALVCHKDEKYSPLMHHALEEMENALEACQKLERQIDLRCTHVLKTDPIPFDDMREGRKTFEVRRFDRNFRVGDRLLLAKFDRDTRCYSGEKLSARIVYILPPGSYGLPEDVGVLGVDNVEIAAP